MILINKIKLSIFRKKWRKKNIHNYTAVSSIVPIDSITIGKYTYGTLNVLMHNNENKLIIGNYCSIAPNVQFIVSADHSTCHFSSYPFKVKILNEMYEGVSKGDIVVEDDVWIGYGATILSGIHIGQGAVIAAGAIVTKNVPPYAIVGGNPARVIKYRFDEYTISKLLKFDFSKLNSSNIKKNINILYEDLNKENVDEILAKLSELGE